VQSLLQKKPCHQPPYKDSRLYRPRKKKTHKHPLPTKPGQEGAGRRPAALNPPWNRVVAKQAPLNALTVWCINFLVNPDRKKTKKDSVEMQERKKKGRQQLNDDNTRAKHSVCLLIIACFVVDMIITP